MKKLITLLACCTALISHANTIKIKPASKAEEQKLIALVKSRKTADGSTVGETLKYVQEARKKRFKVASIDATYSSDSKQPPSTVICFWIGTHRTDSDQYCFLSYVLSPNGKTVTPANDDTKRLDKGRDEFLRFVDEFYVEECGPILSGKPYTC